MTRAQIVSSDDREKYIFWGKTFYDKEEFLEYVKNWESYPADKETIDAFTDFLKNIIYDYFSVCKSKTNRELFDLIMTLSEKVLENKSMKKND